MKRWYYRSYSSYKEPRSIINRAFILADSRKEAIKKGQEKFRDYGRFCSVIPK